MNASICTGKIWIGGGTDKIKVCRVIIGIETGYSIIVLPIGLRIQVVALVIPLPSARELTAADCPHARANDQHNVE